MRALTFLPTDIAWIEAARAKRRPAHPPNAMTLGNRCQPYFFYCNECCTCLHSASSTPPVCYGGTYVPDDNGDDEQEQPVGVRVH